MDEILHDKGALAYSNSDDFRDLSWCKISSINRIACTALLAFEASRATSFNLLRGRGSTHTTIGEFGPVILSVVRFLGETNSTVVMYLDHLGC